MGPPSVINSPRDSEGQVETGASPHNAHGPDVAALQAACRASDREHPAARAADAGLWGRGGRESPRGPLPAVQLTRPERGPEV